MSTIEYEWTTGCNLVTKSHHSMEPIYQVANQELEAQEIQPCPALFSNHPSLGAEDGMLR